MQTKTLARQIFDAIEFQANETKIARGANKVKVIRFAPVMARVRLEYVNPKRVEE